MQQTLKTEMTYNKNENAWKEKEQKAAGHSQRFI